jgi:hypothetical protein
MKFLTDVDAQMFLVEIGEIKNISEVNKSFCPTDVMIESFISKRTGLVTKLKDHRRSQDAKAQWRTNKHSMMKGINTFHKSTEGKRFHRNLGTFLSTRFTGSSKDRKVSEMCEFLKALSSAKTHLLIELTYYHSLDEQVELESLVFDYAQPYFKSIEDKVIAGEDLSEDEEDFLKDVCLLNSAEV